MLVSVTVFNLQIKVTASKPSISRTAVLSAVCAATALFAPTDTNVDFTNSYDIILSFLGITYHLYSVVAMSFFVVTFSAKTLPIFWIPKQQFIPIMIHDMVKVLSQC